MASKSLVIVESPTKAKTITKFLGKGYVVKASMGHVRDLPEGASEIPLKYKKLPWSRLGVNVESEFEPIYVVSKSKKDHIKDLQDELKSADFLYLATDEDREGESISWHLHEILKPKVPTKRLVFNEITKEAIQQALDTAREIDLDLVRAQETRRIVDRLFGYEVSPLLWKKIAPGLSAGRVQSVAVRLLVDREQARIRFRAGKYWTLKAKLAKPDAEPSFEAELVQLAGKRVATSRDFDPETGRLSDPDGVHLLTEADARRAVAALESGPIRVKLVEEKPFVQKPMAPFVTSTLQVEANSKLKYSAKRTMQVAQQLYENGFITYMRTDSTSLSTEAIRGARNLISREYGEAYLPPQPRVYETKVKNAQEAHEAIRPATEDFKDPDLVREQLGEEAFRLYDLVYKRTVACQMTDARGTFTNLQVEAGDAVLRANGKTIEFAGFLKAYIEHDEDATEQERILPKVAVGDVVKCESTDPSEKTTQPPSRYTEGSLIKELERLGIGRPSTWASIVDVVLNRSYAFKKGTALVPTFTAMAVVGLLVENFGNYLDYSYTARLEDDLDAISRGEFESLEYLRTFYHGLDGHGLRWLITRGEADIDPRIVNGITLREAESDTQKKLEVRIGRYGPFVSDGERRASVPDQTPPDEMTVEKALELLDNASKEPESLGLHPQTGEPIYVRVGRFGPYVQLGEAGGETKPKMASLVPGTELSQVDLDYAVKLLALPRNLGPHPETGVKVVAANGRFGPYVQSGEETRSLPADVSPLDVTLEKAVEILSQPRVRGRGVARQTTLKEFGANPASGKVVKMLSGRYGPYVTDGEVNATVPRGSDPLQVTAEQAFQLLADRAAVIAENGGPAAKKIGKKAPRKTQAKAKGKKVTAVAE